MEGLSKLGIDFWSILIYILNTGLLLFVLTFVLYKPILKFLDERRRQIKSSVEEAQNLKEELNKKSAEVHEAMQKAEMKLKQEMENLRKYTEEKRLELTAEMDKARRELLARAEEEITRRKTEILQDAEQAMLQLIKKIVLHIVKNKVPEEVVEDSIKSAWQSAQSTGFARNRDVSRNPVAHKSESSAHKPKKFR